jgi:hypothetical protein
MTTEHDSRTTKTHDVFHIEPYTRPTPPPDPSVECRVVIPGAAVICTRIVSRGTSPFPSLQVRGRETPGHAT